MRLDAPLRGSQLTLRSLTSADASGPYLGWMTDPRVLRYLEARHVTHHVASLTTFIESSNTDPAVLLLGIVTADGRHIGNIKLGPIDAQHRRADIGILIGETTMWGRGYAPEAIRTLAGHAFGRLRLRKLTAGFYESNGGSIRAFQKAGFQEEARLFAHWRLDNSREDGILMAKFP